MLELKIITGMSGAGKSQFLRMMEDLGYFTVDHLPLEMLGALIHTLAGEERRVAKAALAVDVREHEHFDEFFMTLQALDPKDVQTEIIFLEASPDVLVRRFRETRRRHPLGQALRILAAIEAEERIMAPLREIADRRIDTGYITAPQMQTVVARLFAPGDTPRLMVNVVSFGFKYGIPHDVDFLLDVRFLPNPYYDPSLRNICGTDRPVIDFVASAPEYREFVSQMEKMIPFLLDSFEEVQRDHIVFGVGCTGGQHRSVVMAETVCRLAGEHGYCATVNHRDLR